MSVSEKQVCIQDSKLIEEHISKNYNFECLSISLIKDAGNQIYLIDTKAKKYIFRVLKSKFLGLEFSKSFCLFEIELLNFLKTRHFPISHPVPTIKDGCLGSITLKDGKYYTSLFSYAKGFVSEKPKEYKTGEISLLGESIAMFHQELNDFKTDHRALVYNKKALVNDPLEILKNLDISESIHDPIKAALIDIGPKIEAYEKKARRAEGSWGVVGGDFNGENQHFDGKGNIILFDFEFCGMGPRVYDLGVALHRIWLCLRQNESLWNPFMRGYTSIRPLTQEDIEMIPIYGKARQIWRYCKKSMLDKLNSQNPFEKK